MPRLGLTCAAVKEVDVCVRRDDTTVDGKILGRDAVPSPLTNSWCESRQANMDRIVKFSGGSTSLQTLSNKEVVSGNK